MRALACAIGMVGISLTACSISLESVGTWADLATPPGPLEGSRAVAVSDTEVIFIGGFDLRGGQSTNEVVRLDLRTNQWSRGAPIPVDQAGYSVAALSNGSVLVAGGTAPNENAGPPASWLYEPTTNTWRKVGGLNVPRSGAVTVTLSDGRVLIAGGSVPLVNPIQLPDGSTAYFEFTNTAEIFDPSTNAWTLVRPLHIARGVPALVALPHGAAMAAGGCAFATQRFDSGGALSSAEVFDPVAGAWKITGSLPAPRCGADGVLLRDGRVLVVGGATSNFQQASVNDAAIYEAKTGKWSAAGSMVSGASPPVLLADGRVFVAAVQVGQPNGHVVPLVVGGQIFDPGSDDWNFVTSTSALATFQPGIEGSRPVAARPDGTQTIVVSVAGDSFALNPIGPPPSGPILTSSRLTLVLGAFAIALGLWLAFQFFRGRLREGP